MPRNIHQRSICALLFGALTWGGLSGWGAAPACAQAGCAGPAFSPAANFAAGNSPRSVAVADFNGDGNGDLVTANLNSDNVSVLLGNGAGGFTGPTNFDAGMGPNTVAAADFNGDGKIDLAVANQNPGPASPQHSVSILTGAGDGSFSAPTDFPVGSFPSDLVVADFNGDGKRDVATANQESSADITVLLGDGAGGFAAPVSTPSSMAGFSPAYGLAVGDFNADGKSDLAALREKRPQPPFGTGNLTVFLGTGAGGFTAGATVGVGHNPSSVAVGNFNADANSDIAVTNRASGTVSVLLGSGGGNLSAPAEFGVGSGPQSVAVGDFNLDGRSDLAVANQAGFNNNVSVLTGDGAGGFTAPTNFAVGGAPGSVAVADFNKDGKGDLAAANFTSANVSVLLNSCGAGGPAQISFQFKNATHAVHEDRTFVVVSVTRTGLTAPAATVDYSTVSGTASERSDYTTALGTLRFAAGETEKFVTVLIAEDSLVEGPESFTVSLSNPSAGAALGAQSTATVEIEDDPSEPSANAIDDPDLFVGQHYHDFLNRRYDPSGLLFWTGEIRSCGPDAACIDFKRANVSQAFFLSIEFQRTGYQVFRVYKATFADSAQRPKGLPRFREFLRDTQELQRGVVVGQGDWEQRLAANLREFIRRWVASQEFVELFPAGMTAQEFVDRLFANSEVIPTQAERDAALAAFGGGGAQGREDALLSATNSGSVYNRQYNPAFVLMQYFGYLRRNPSDAPEPTLDFQGYDFWLGKLNEFSLPGEDVRSEEVARRRALRAEMVRSFLLSGEYRQRFGR